LTVYDALILPVLKLRREAERSPFKREGAVYVLTGLTLVHYLLSPDVYAEQYLLSGIFFWLMGWRPLKRRGQATGAKGLAVLAVASCLFTILLEAVWLWAYQGYGLLEALAGNFTLMEDLSPAWKVLALGFLVAVIGAVRPFLPPLQRPARPAGLT
jgi:sulfoxide reductase heme-binding subunit YedZ